MLVKSFQNGDYRETYVQIFNDRGQKFGDEILVDSDNSLYLQEACITSLLNGNFVVCWRDVDNNSSPHIVAQLFNNQGIKVGNKISVSFNLAPSYKNRPYIVELKNGNFLICWDSDNKIYFRLFDSNGNIIGNESQIEKTGIGVPKSAPLSNGGYVISWLETIDYFSYKISFQIFNSVGILVGNETNAFYVDFGNRSGFQSIEGLSMGRFIICFSLEKDGSNYGIYAKMFSEFGIQIGDEFQVNTYVDNSQHSPIVKKLSDDRFVISWRSSEQDGNKLGIYAQIYDQNKRYGTEFKINSYTENTQYDQAIAGLSNGNIFSCWVSSKGNTNDDNIFGKYYLSEPINHILNNFEIINPSNDKTFYDPKITFNWNQASYTRINFPWELTYDLYIDSHDSFSAPITITGIQDTTYQIDSLQPGRTYFCKVLARNISGDSLWSSNVNGFYIEENATDVIEIKSSIPDKYELLQNYPNPFNPTTTISYSIPQSPVMLNLFQHLNNSEIPKQVRDDNVNVTIKVYDVLGREIKTLVNKSQSPGNYEITFDATEYPSGIYYYKLVAGDFIETKKMLLLK